MKYYKVTIGTKVETVYQPSLKEAKQLAQWLKQKWGINGKTTVKLIGYINQIN
jgi:hypothetical protein